MSVYTAITGYESCEDSARFWDRAALAWRAEGHCADAGELEESDDGEASAAGWYYWFCFPGYMPDSSPFGPFRSEREAVEAAREEWAP